MKNVKKKVVAMLGAATILSTSVYTGAVASGIDIKGKIANMKIFNNGTAMSLPADQKPIIVNNRTYLPIRALGEALGKQINWDKSDPNSVYITSQQDQQNYNKLVLDFSQAKFQLVEKDNKIAELEKQVKELEEKLEKKEEESKEISLSDLENDLNRSYGRYRGVDLEIDLSGNKDKIKVKVYIDKNYRTDWDNLDKKDREKLVDEIVYDIQREYKKAKVEGTVDSGYSDTSIDFYTNSSDKLIINDGNSDSYTSDDIEDVEDRIYRKYSDLISNVKIYEGKDYIDIEIDSRYSLTDSQLWSIEDFAKEEAEYYLSKSKTIRVYID